MQDGSVIPTPWIWCEAPSTELTVTIEQEQRMIDEAPQILEELKRKVAEVQNDDSIKKNGKNSKSWFSCMLTPLIERSSESHRDKYIEEARDSWEKLAKESKLAHSAFRELTECTTAQREL